MAGAVLDASSQVICVHGGTAKPASSSPRVAVAGQPAVTIADPCTVSGCSFVPPPGNGPCATATWKMAATRVSAGGSPLAIQTGVASCVPTGTGLQALIVQARVVAS